MLCGFGAHILGCALPNQNSFSHFLHILIDFVAMATTLFCWPNMRVVMLPLLCSELIEIVCAN